MVDKRAAPVSFIAAHTAAGFSSAGFAVNLQAAARGLHADR